MRISLRHQRRVRFVVALAVWLAAFGGTAGPPLNARPAALAERLEPPTRGRRPRTRDGQRP